MTTLYLIRHSKPMYVNDIINTDDYQIRNEKLSLSIDGEQIAKEKLYKPIFNNIDILYTSNYVRTIQTAKYIAEINNLEINVVSNLGERKFGAPKSQRPSDFEAKQFEDENYKIGDGESHSEVRQRMLTIVNKILNNNKGKTIAIVGHATAFACLLKTWCEVHQTSPYLFKNKEFFDGRWNYCETFKLEFDDNNNLISIKNIK